MPSVIAQSTCSSGGTQEEFVTTFLNDTDADVVVHWINYDCAEADGTPIAAGESFEFTTYDGHEFVFRDTTGAEIAPYTVTTQIAGKVVALSQIISALELQPTCSSSGTLEQLNTAFLNDTTTDVVIHWLQPDCTEADGTPLAVGASYPFTTYDGHEFLIRGVDGGALARYTATTADSDQVISLSQLISVQPSSRAEKVDSMITLTGNLAPDVERNTYSFEAEAGVIYVILMTSTDFDTYLHLYDARNVEIAANDDGTGDLNSLIAMVLPEAGWYTVGIDSYEDGATGNYMLSISHPTTVISDFLTAETTSSTSTLDVEAGVTYFVRAESTDFDTYLSVSDETGTQIAANDDAGVGLTNSFVLFTAQSTGTYTVNVVSFDGISTGTFSVLLGSLLK